MHSTARPRLYLLVGAWFALLWLQTVFVQSGNVNSPGRSQRAGVDRLGGGQSRSSNRDPTRSDSFGAEAQRAQGMLQLPETLTVFQVPNPVTDESVQPLSSRLKALGYHGATAVVHDGSPKRMEEIKRMVLEQMSNNPDQKKFIESSRVEGVKTYAMVLSRPSDWSWPRHVGKVAGENGIQKAAILGVFRSEPGPPRSPQIQLHGIAKIKNANKLHEPSEEARQLMHNVPEMLRF